MSKLPEDLNNRFILYLNVLPMVEKVVMYVLFCTGAMFLLGSMLRVLLLNWELQKKSANMDFRHGNSEELKRIHLKKMKSRANKLTSDRMKEVEAFYNSLLAPSAADDSLEENMSNTEMDVLAGDAKKATSIIIPDQDEGNDNYNCDKVETPPPQYDLINFYLLKEDVV